jgi:hypothetical protein
MLNTQAFTLSGSFNEGKDRRTISNVCCTASSASERSAKKRRQYVRNTGAREANKSSGCIAGAGFRVLPESVVSLLMEVRGSPAPES